MFVTNQRRFSRLKAVGLAVLALVAVMALMLAGHQAASSSASQGAAASAAKTPIKVGVMAAIGSPLGNFPEIFSADKAAARAINAAGGIQGHPVQIVTCNGQASANPEAACARSLISKGVIALAGSNFIAADANINQLLTAAKVANVASTTPQPVDYSSPDDFQIDFYAGSYIACVSKRMAAIAKTKKVVATAYQLPVSLATINAAVKPAAVANGLTFEDTVAFPATTSNFAPTAQQIINSGAGLVLPVIGPSAFAPVLAAVAQAGGNPSYCAAEGLGTPAALSKTGAAAKKVYVAQALPPYTATGRYPILKQFAAQMKAESKAGDKGAALALNQSTPYSLRAWLGMQVIKQAASKVKGPITPASFFATLGKSKVSLGNIATLNFAKPKAFGPFTRLFNTNLQFSKFNTKTKAFDLVPNSNINLVP